MAADLSEPLTKHVQLAPEQGGGFGSADVKDVDLFYEFQWVDYGTSGFWVDLIVYFLWMFLSWFKVGIS